MSESAKEPWPYLHRTLDIGGNVEIATQSWDFTVSCLECDGQMVCMIESHGMSMDAIMARLEQLAKRFHEEGMVTDEVNGSEYCVW